MTSKRARERRKARRAMERMAKGNTANQVAPDLAGLDFKQDVFFRLRQEKDYESRTKKDNKSQSATASVGVADGLFGSRCFQTNLAIQVLRKALSFLKENEILFSITTSRDWNKVSIEELKGRESCVTIITWLPRARAGFIRSNPEGFDFASSPSWGHSALRTYKDGPNGMGVYVSLFPGLCQKANRTFAHDMYLCHSAVSHFHTSDQDDLSLQSSIRTEVDIYGLNVVAVNNAFARMQTVEGNSRLKWLPIRNCSDIVFFLLEESGLHGQLSLRYSNRVIFIISFTFSAVSKVISDFLASTMYWRGKSFIPTYQSLMPISFQIKTTLESALSNVSLWLYKTRFSVENWSKGYAQQYALQVIDGFQQFLAPYLSYSPGESIRWHGAFTSVVVNSRTVIVGGASAFFIAYLYSLLTFYKSIMPFHIKNRMAISGAIRASIICMVITSTELIVRHVMKSYDYYANTAILPTELIGRHFFIEIIDHLLEYFPSFGLISMISIPLVLLAPPIFAQFGWDTKTTPQHVLDTLNKEKLIAVHFSNKKSWLSGKRCFLLGSKNRSSASLTMEDKTMPFSKLARNRQFNENQWVVSLINTKTGIPGLYGGHAKIIVEGIRKLGANNDSPRELFVAEYHIMEVQELDRVLQEVGGDEKSSISIPQAFRNTKCKYAVLVKEDKAYNERQEKQYSSVQSESWPTTPNAAMAMAADIKREQADIKSGEKDANFQYAGQWRLYGYTGAHNCITWAESKLAIARVGHGKILTDSTKAVPSIHVNYSNIKSNIKRAVLVGAIGFFAPGGGILRAIIGAAVGGLGKPAVDAIRYSCCRKGPS